MQITIALPRMAQLYLGALHRVGGAAADEDISSDRLLGRMIVSLRDRCFSPGAVPSLAVVCGVEVSGAVVSCLSGSFGACEGVVRERGQFASALVIFEADAALLTVQAGGNAQAHLDQQPEIDVGDHLGLAAGRAGEPL